MAPWRDQLAAALDAPAPWFEPWRDSGLRVSGDLAVGTALHDALNSQGADVRFVETQSLPEGMAYERYISDTGNCPTRDNLHDFFNGLAWLEFPQTKKKLNRVQAEQIAAAGVGSVRGPVRDAATLFDENGAVLTAPGALWEALAARDWQRLFIDLRPMWAQARLLVFGHALLEKLVQPRKNLTAHIWAAPCPAGPMAEVDDWLADQLAAQRLAAKPFLTLPVLGVPGWWPGNADFSFYDDRSVFRLPAIAPP